MNQIPSEYVLFSVEVAMKWKHSLQLLHDMWSLDEHFQVCFVPFFSPVISLPLAKEDAF